MVLVFFFLLAASIAGFLLPCYHHQGAHKSAKGKNDSVHWKESRFMLPTLAASLAMLATQQNVLVEDKLHRDAEAAKRAAMKPERLGGWNAGFKVLFKGKIMGEMTVPDEDGRMMQSIIVKSANGGVSRVQLAPKEWVEAAALRFYENTPIWIAGSKAWDGDAWVVHAQRVNMEGVRPSFRREDGTPFWEPRQ